MIDQSSLNRFQAMISPNNKLIGAGTLTIPAIPPRVLSRQFKNDGTWRLDDSFPIRRRIKASPEETFEVVAYEHAWHEKSPLTGWADHREVRYLVLLPNGDLPRSYINARLFVNAINEHPIMYMIDGSPHYIASYITYANFHPFGPNFLLLPGRELHRYNRDHNRPDYEVNITISLDSKES